MDTAHHDFTRAHYGPRARDYLDSPTHAQGEDLDQIETFVARLRPARVLDLGSGGGHVAYRAAPHAGEVVASDLSEDMLATIAAAAHDRGLTNIRTCQSPAERLPFGDASFAVVLSRFSAHHWPDMAAGLREARRVLPAGGHAMFVDSIAPAAPVLDTYMQAIELLRDPTHVRNYRSDEWVAALSRSGFDVVGLTRRRLRLAFGPWAARTRMTPPQIAALRALQSAAPPEVAIHFAFEPDGSWTLDKLAVEAVAV